jgi:metallo-beta-lactamase family protein
VQRGRHPLSFEQLLTINDHQEHLRTIDYLKQSGRPAIVIALERDVQWWSYCQLS